MGPFTLNRKNKHDRIRRVLGKLNAELLLTKSLNLMKQEADWFKTLVPCSDSGGEGKQYQQAEKGRKQIHGQQVYEQIPEGLDRKIRSNIPNPMIAETGAVRGIWSAMKWQGSCVKCPIAVSADRRPDWMDHRFYYVGHLFSYILV